MIVRGTRDTANDGTAVAAADPAVNRLIVGPFVQLQNKGASDVTVKLKLGTREIYDVLLEPKIAVLITDFPDEAGAGAADEDLYVNLDGAVAVYYQIQVREITF